MDDAKRFITGWEMLFDKKGEAKGRVFRRIRESGPSPCVLGSDNGREFRGDLFLNVLTQFGIRTWYIRPYRQSPKLVTPITTVYLELLLFDHFSGYDFAFRSHVADNHNVSKIINYFISLEAV
jgi:transposase InsO family protein